MTVYKTATYCIYSILKEMVYVIMVIADVLALNKHKAIGNQ